MIVVTDAAWKEVPVLLVNALFFAAQQRIPLDSRFAIGVAGLHPALAEQFDKSVFFHPGGWLRRRFRGGRLRRRDRKGLSGHFHFAGGARLSVPTGRPGVRGETSGSGCGSLQFTAACLCVAHFFCRWRFSAKPPAAEKKTRSPENIVALHAASVHLFQRRLSAATS